jgi:hypothetical protein
MYAVTRVVATRDVVSSSQGNIAAGRAEWDILFQAMLAQCASIA